MRLRFSVTALVTMAAVGALGLAPAASGAALKRAGWLRNVVITEYYPVPEAWFSGAPVEAPGLDGTHRVDWLYSARGVMMEGDGIGLDGKRYHLESGFGGAWVNEAGRPTRPGLHGSGWSGGAPFWRNFGWRTPDGRVTFPTLADDGTWGWSIGQPALEKPVPANVSFAPGASVPLRYYRSAAVDPRLIPLGSRVFVPAYCGTAGKGWMRAADTGGAITGRHIDVYRTPPKTMDDQGQMLARQAIYVIPPGAKAPKRLPRCPATPPAVTSR